MWLQGRYPTSPLDICVSFLGQVEFTKGAQITCYHNNFARKPGQVFLFDSELFHLEGVQ